MKKTLLQVQGNLLAVFLLFTLPALGQERPMMAGEWVINESLSDNTDRQVEKALRAAGEKVKRCWLNCKEDRFRGGPEEQELYDRISYDDVLSIGLEAPVYLFTYADGYRREVYTDGRSQSVSLTGIDEVEDFSFAHWENGKLLVEGRPRDGGFTNESYSLINEGAQLQAELYIKPRIFGDAIEIKRVYDRVR